MNPHVLITQLQLIDLGNITFIFLKYFCLWPSWHGMSNNEFRWQHMDILSICWGQQCLRTLVRQASRKRVEKGGSWKFQKPEDQSLDPQDPRTAWSLFLTADRKGSPQAEVGRAVTRQHGPALARREWADVLALANRQDFGYTSCLTEPHFVQLWRSRLDLGE